MWQKTVRHVELIHVRALQPVGDHREEVHDHVVLLEILELCVCVCVCVCVSVSEREVLVWRQLAVAALMKDEGGDRPATRCHTAQLEHADGTRPNHTGMAHTA
jgi:hypothetical protein